MTAPARIWVARTDKLGDVLMSLGALVYVKRALPEAEVYFICREAVVPAIAPLLREESITPFPYDVAVSPASQPPDAALMLFDEPKLAFRLFRGRTQLRSGNYSKPFSFFLLNHGKKQHRSRGVMSEALYNFELAKAFVEKIAGGSDEEDTPKLEIPVDQNDALEAREAMQARGIEEPFVVLHPGMAGSAVNLSAERYLTVLDTLAAAGRGRVVLSAGPHETDREMTSRLLALRPETRHITGLSIGGLRELFRMAECVVAPSTGPLHLAHYVGTSTVGIYPPVRSQHPRRWSPFGGTGNGKVLFPEVDCPAQRQCLGPRCAHYPCLEPMDWRGLILGALDALKVG